MGKNDGDGFASDDRNFLRAVEAYGGFVVQPADVARSLGISCQAVVKHAKLLEKCGLLAVKRLPKQTSYTVTEAGRAELAANRSVFLLVEVDDRTAPETTWTLEHSAGLTVTVHGPGCCCKNCPWGGDHG